MKEGVYGTYDSDWIIGSYVLNWEVIYGQFPRGTELDSV